MKDADAEHTGVITPPPVIYGAGLLLAMLLHWYRPLALVEDGAGSARALGGILVVVGLALDTWGAWTLRRHNTAIHPHHSASALVTGGPYRFSRNPLYVGLTLVFLGLTLIVNSLWGLLVLVPVLVLMHYGVVRQEERHLEARFGDAFRAYREHVRRYL